MYGPNINHERAVELCSAALLKLGADSISSFEDATAEAKVAARLYPLVRDAMLSAHPWSFATRKAELARLAGASPTDFAYAHQLPNDFLKALSAGDAVRGRALTYQIISRELHSDAEDVVLSYLFRPSEGDFPAYFTPALVTKLAAEFCLPLTENAGRAERLARLADDELKIAKLIDHQEMEASDFVLPDAREQGAL